MSFWHHPLVKNIGPVQFGSLFSTTLAATIGTMTNATIMAVALLGDIAWQEVLLWWTSLFTCSVYAIVRWQKNRGKQPKTTSKRAVRKLTAAAVIFALPWAYLVIAYLGQLSQGVELILVAVIAGMTAAGSLHLSRIYPAAIAYLSTLTLAGIISCFLLGTPEYYLLAGLVLSYAIFLVKVINVSAQMSIDRTLAIQSLKEKIVEMDKTKADLEKFAMEDPLTSLPNRREFHARLTSAIDDAKLQGTAVSLLLCDLDHFKNINDISGHAAGDTILVKIADRLKATIPDHDIVARIGGDEFAIIAKHHKSPKDTLDFANRLLESINQPVSIDGRDVVPGMSVGISMFPYDALDIKSILAHADLALQRGKSAGRGNYNFFDQKMKSQLSTDEALESDLRIALVEEEFELFYQPKICIRSGILQGFEALLRWRRSDNSIVTPGEFFHVAEERGLMSYISDFVIEQALKDIRTWHDQGLDPGKMSINVHPTQIKDEHRMKRLVRDVERSGVNPSDIFLEITEGCIIGRGTENIPEMLEYLRNKGFRISLDDFGTGYASLSHLKELPVDELKFDRSFISDLMSNASTRAIVHAMVKLANSLGIATVAEGIETRQQHNVLMAIGCTTGQGFLYNKALEFEAATRLLVNAKNNTPTPVSVTASSPVSPKILAQNIKSA